MAATTRTYPELDGMRAVASVAIVVTHTAFWAGIYDDGVLGALTHRLEVGVAIFFVLSGFLLGRPWVARALHRGSTERARTYYRKRVFRILPVYLLTVVAALTLVRVNRGADAETWFANLTLAAHLVDEPLPEGLTQMWSLAVEACFYLLLPLIGWLLVRLAGGRAGRLLLALALVCAASVTWLVVTWSLDSSYAAHQLPAYMTWFAGGFALATLATDDTTRLARATRTAGTDRLTCWVGAAAVMILVSTPLGGPVGLTDPSVSAALVRHLGYAVVAVLAVAPCVLAPRDDSWLAHPVVRHLGHTSYALFCCHVIVLVTIMEVAGFTQFAVAWPLLFALTLAVSLLVSEVLYRFVERPANRYGHRRARGQRRAAPTPPRRTTVRSRD